MQSSTFRKTDDTSMKSCLGEDDPGQFSGRTSSLSWANSIELGNYTRRWARKKKTTPKLRNVDSIRGDGELAKTSW